MTNRKFIYAATKGIFLLSAFSFLLSSCQQEDDFAPQEQEQVLRIATRSTTEGTAEAFTDNFTLVLRSETGDTECYTHSMTYTDVTGWNTVTLKSSKAYAFAYKGSSVIDISYTDKWNYTVTLQTDQSDATKLADADVMIATGSANAESPLDLNFQHYFSKVIFDATLATEFGDTYNITTLDVMTADGKTVNAYVDGKTVSAIVTAGTYTAGSEFLSIKVSGAEKPLTVKVPSGGLTFNAGTHYTFALKVGKDKVTLTEVSTNPSFPGGWDNGEFNINK